MRYSLEPPCRRPVVKVEPSPPPPPPPPRVEPVIPAGVTPSAPVGSVTPWQVERGTVKGGNTASGGDGNVVDVGKRTPLVPPPPDPEEVARANIKKILQKWCDATGLRSPEGIRAVYPSAQPETLRKRFDQSKSSECSLTGEPQFKELNAEAGTATVEVDVNQAFELKAGSKSMVQDTTAAVKLTRPESRGDWRIDTLEARPKKKK